MLNLLLQAGLLILRSVAGFLSVLLLARLFMQFFRVSFSNQVGSFVLRLTNWLVLPLRRFIPAFKNIDLASLLPVYVLQLIVITASIGLSGQLATLSTESTVILIMTRSLLALLHWCIYLLIGLLVLQAIISWVNPGSPLARPIGQMTQPILRPIQRLVPPIADIDLSPLIAILLAQIILIFL